MSDRLDGGDRSVIGGELPRTVGGRGDRFDKGSGETKRLEQDRKGERGPVDPRNGKGLSRPPGMDVQAFLGVRKLTDLELGERVLAIKVYRANGLTLRRAATKMGVPLGLLQSWLSEARERKLTLPALDAARAYVEDHLVDMAVDTVQHHLKQRNLEAGLATLRGTGVFRQNDAPIDGRLPMALTVTMVDASGSIINVGAKAPTLEGVIGVAKQDRYDVPAERDDLG